MIKSKTTYSTKDGKEFKTKKAAQRHVSVLFMEERGHSKQEVDEIILKIAETNNRIQRFLNSDKYNVWEDWLEHHIEQLAELVTEFKENIVTYELFDHRDKSVSRVKQKESDNIPQEFIDYVDNLKRTGYVYSLEKTATPHIYTIVETKLTLEEFIRDNIKLSESDIEDMLWENKVIYEEEGENRRWSKSMLSVVELPNGDLYAISWDKGLTEYQENSFYDQPKKVKELKKEIKTIQVEEIKVIYEEEKE